MGKPNQNLTVGKQQLLEKLCPASCTHSILRSIPGTPHPQGMARGRCGCGWAASAAQHPPAPNRSFPQRSSLTTQPHIPNFPALGTEQLSPVQRVGLEGSQNSSQPCQGHFPPSQAAPSPSNLVWDISRDPAALGIHSRLSPISQGRISPAHPWNCSSCPASQPLWAAQLK